MLGIIQPHQQLLPPQAGLPSGCIPYSVKNSNSDQKKCPQGCELSGFDSDTDSDKRARSPLALGHIGLRVQGTSPRPRGCELSGSGTNADKRACRRACMLVLALLYLGCTVHGTPHQPSC